LAKEFITVKLIGMKPFAKKPYGVMVLLVCCVCFRSFGQDTVRLTLPAVEKLFIQHNLALLAEKYNIDLAEAQVIQAKLYNNPNFQFTGNIYNPERHKITDVSNGSGQYTFGVEQLVVLAGKRNKQVRLAATIDLNFKDQLDNLLQGVTDNFRKRNISQLELIDFYQGYKDNILQFNQLLNARRQAIEDLHFAVGKTLFN
jgi:cobalt-zinc-cadmium efflux system outer membrane protein